MGERKINLLRISFRVFPHTLNEFFKTILEFGKQFGQLAQKYLTNIPSSCRGQSYKTRLRPRADGCPMVPLLRPSRVRRVDRKVRADGDAGRKWQRRQHGRPRQHFGRWQQFGQRQNCKTKQRQEKEVKQVFFVVVVVSQLRSIIFKPSSICAHQKKIAKCP